MKKLIYNYEYMEEMKMYEGITSNSKVDYMTKSDVKAQIERLLEKTELTEDLQTKINEKIGKKVNINAKCRTYDDLCDIRTVLENKVIEDYKEEIEKKEVIEEILEVQKQLTSIDNLNTLNNPNNLKYYKLKALYIVLNGLKEDLKILRLDLKHFYKQNITQNLIEDNEINNNKPMTENEILNFELEGE